MEKHRKINFNITLTNTQKDIYRLATDDTFKFLTVVCSRQQGKSTVMMVLCVQWLLEKNAKIGYVCRNNVFAETAFGDLVRIFPQMLVKKANSQSKVIETIYGSSIRFFSAESGNSLRGQSFHYLICDEFSYFKFEQTDGTDLWYHILSPTVKVKGRKCIFVSTPLGKNNRFYEMYQRGLTDEFPQYKSILKTIYDDGIIPKEDIEPTRLSMPEMAWRQEYLCEFLESAYSFFSGYDECFIPIKHQYQKTYIGVDLSGNGQDATILTKINEKNEVEQYEIQGTLDMKYQQIANIINESKNLQMCYLENNGLGTPMINEIKKLVKDKTKIREWTTSNVSKEEIMSDLAVTIAKKEIFFDKLDKSLYNEFGTFVANFTKGGHLQFGAISGKHDDRIMSLAIALRCRNDFYSKVTKSFFEVVRI